LYTANRIHLKTGIPVAYDFRDIPEQNMSIFFSFKSRLKLARNSLFRAKCLQKASFVTTVSLWHQKFLSQFNNNVHLIYNGFDSELFYATEKHKISPYFDIVYTGSVEDTMSRDPSFLFKALSILQKKNSALSKELRVVFYSSDISFQKVKNLCLEIAPDIIGLLHHHEFVPFEEIPQILRDASVLLVLSAPAKIGCNGMMTTKFFEYLGVNRPILQTQSDEGCLEEVMKSADAGCSARSIEDALTFIEKMYLQWKSQGYTSSSSNQDIVKAFSRKVQVAQFEALFNLIPCKQ